MAKLSPTEKNVLKFLGGVLHLPNMPDVPFISVELGRSGITVEYPPKNSAITKKFHKQFEDFMKQYFNSLLGLSSGGVRTANGDVYVLLSPSKSGSTERKGGVIPTKIQEKGTTIVFNQVLDKNKIFEQEQDILGDVETKKKLLACFGKQWEGRLEDWTWSYFQQQKEFFDEYKDNKWSPFVYDNQNFVDFFKGLVKKVKTGNNEPLKPLGTYETWNPSDIWAAYEMDKIKKEIDDNLKPTIKLVELNNLLIKLFKDKRLVGLSLKKVLYGQDAKLKFVNTDTSKMKLGDIEEYTIKDIKLQIDNICTGETVTTYVKYGSNNDYAVNINNPSKSRGTNLSFNTHIKATPAAQGGQAPVALVEKLLRRKPGSSATYINDWHKFPKDVDTFHKESGKYEKMYNVVKKHIGKPLDWEEFKLFIGKMYVDDKKIFVARAKLMHLHFFYDAINNYGSNSEFWTDLLYLGMKVGERFAPHAKIS